MIDDLVENLRLLDERNAAQILLEALGRHASTQEEYDIVARNFFKIKRYAEALPYTEKSLALASTNEQKFSARLNYVNVLAHAYQPEKALDEIKILEMLNPNDKDVRLKKAYALFLMGRRDEAEKILRDELKNPTNDEKTINDIEFNLGTYELYKDNFQEGLYRFLIHGRKMDLWKKPQLPFTEWKGVVPGHIVVIRAEAGIGDEFINIRFMKHMKERGMIPIWFTDRKEMRDMFNRHGYTAVSSVDEVKPHWNGKDIYWCHSMDIPVLLKLEYKDLWYGPYLFAKSEAQTQVRDTGKLRIGLRWQGNPDYDNDLHRSVPLDELYEAAKVLDADFYSLQRDTGAEDVYQFPEIVPLHKTTLKTFEETLSIISSLDVVITSCTSIGHAAAAMGKRTFILTPMSSYYTWCHSMKQSPWYGDNLTLLRQRRPRYWDQPLQELKDALLRDFSGQNT